MQAFILAGGFATRLWPLTEKRAKPLLPLAGKPLLTHLVEKIPERMSITVSTNQVFAEDFEKWKESLHASSAAPLCHPERSEPKVSEDEGGSGASAQHDTLEILIEDAGHEDEKLGALGAFSKWITENSIQEDVLLLAGDNYIGFSLADFIAYYDGQNTLYAVYDLLEGIDRDIKDPELRTKLALESAKQFGIVEGTSTGIRADIVVRTNWNVYVTANFEEKPPQPKSTLVSTGCYIFPRNVLPTIQSFAVKHPDNIGKVLKHLFDTGKTTMYVNPLKTPFFDIGSFDAYLAATHTLVGDNVLDLRNHAATTRPTTFQYTSILKAAAKATATAKDNENVYEGSIVLGRNAKVRKSRLRNVVLFEDCTIEDCILENCIIDAGSHLRGVDLTHKMIRAGTNLMRNF